MVENILTIKEYFGEGRKTFIIPNYQRGFKWGVPDNNYENQDAVEVLINNLINAYENKLSEYFIQGVTVHETESRTEIVLVDGQQRTTFFYLLLKYLKCENLPSMNYAIRQESNIFLKEVNVDINRISEDFKENLNEEFQDIFYFKKAIRTIHRKVEKIDKENFKEFILNKVRLFYIKIDKDKATRTFRMMNGNKAIMKDEELIKSTLLTKVSTIGCKRGNEEIKESDINSLLQIIKQKVGEEWEINTLRSKYAREWDKWLYWWNRDDVKKYFYKDNESKPPLGLLLKYYFELNHPEKKAGKKYDFQSFDKHFFDGNKNVKKHYKGIRDLQKKFEDLYNNVETYNYMGLIIKGGGNRKEALLEYFSNEEMDIKEYAKWALLGINNKDINILKQKAIDILLLLTNKIVYGLSNKEALRQLLRMNVILDNQLGRKFDFTIYDNKSLEHIYPKSWENEKDSKLKFEDEDAAKYSVHCIGNLVLIKSNDNSGFGNKCFDRKKEMYFNTNKEEKPIKWSLKLLHSVAIFSQKEWNEKSIMKNQEAFIKSFNQYYNINNEQ